MEERERRIVRWVCHVTGQVQGVGYRALVQEVARGHPVVGTVRNEEDGGVRIEVQGEPDRLERFLAEVMRPRGAIRPASLERGGDLPADARLEGFRVVHGDR